MGSFEIYCFNSARHYSEFSANKLLVKFQQSLPTALSKPICEGITPASIQKLCYLNGLYPALASNNSFAQFGSALKLHLA
jgi:hypothetical protein